MYLMLLAVVAPQVAQDWESPVFTGCRPWGNQKAVFRAASNANVFVVSCGEKSAWVYRDSKWSKFDSGAKSGAAVRDLSADGSVALVSRRSSLITLQTASGNVTEIPCRFRLFDPAILAPDGKRCAHVGSNGVSVFNTKSLKQEGSAKGGFGTDAIGISKDASRLVLFAMGNLEFVTTRTVKELLPANDVRAVCIGVDQKKALVETKTKELRMYDFEGQLQATLKLPSRSLHSQLTNGGELVQLRSDGKAAAFLGEDQSVLLLKVGDRELSINQKLQIPSGQKPRAIQFTHDNKLAVLLSAGAQYKVVTYKLPF